MQKREENEDMCFMKKHQVSNWPWNTSYRTDLAYVLQKKNTRDLLQFFQPSIFNSKFSMKKRD